MIHAATNIIIKPIVITSPEHCADFLRQFMRLDVEEFFVLAFDSERKLIAHDCLFRGSVDTCMFHPRDVFRFAIKHNAVSIIIAHNHPSDNKNPSPEDLRVTTQIVKAGKLLQIPVSDHIIVTKHDHFSFLAEGKL